MKRINSQLTNCSISKCLLLTLGLILLLNLNAYSKNRYISFRDSSSIALLDNIAIPSRDIIISNNFELTYQVPGAMVSDAIVSDAPVLNKTFSFINIDGYSKLPQIGAPALPVRYETVALPRATVGEIEIINLKYIEYDNFQIHPTLAPAVDTDGAPSPQFEIDIDIYKSNQFYPQNVVEIKSYGKKRETVLAYIQICPVQYNPVSGKIRVYSEIEFKITSTGNLNNFDYIANDNTQHFTDLLKRSVINSESIPNGIADPSKTEGGLEYNYIIITHQEYLSEAMRLANWKRQLGYTVEVVSQESWTSAEVKSAIHDRYNSWSVKPDYFVIIGDHNGSYAVPGEIITSPEMYASDAYYSCIDGINDYVPDMAHGRISVSSLAEARVVIDKIINYEKNPTTNSSFYNNILNCAQYQDDLGDGYADRRFCHTSEEIRDYLQNNYSYNSTRIYSRSGSADVSTLRYENGFFSNGQLLPSELRDPSFNWNGTSVDITNEINAGKFMVFHRDHGYIDGSGWAHPYYTTSTMNNLNNGENLPVVFSMNCNTGEFQRSNCFAEKLMRMENKGAVGVVAAAYESYSGYNDALSLGMIDAIWSNPGLYGEFGSSGNQNTYTIGAGNEIYTMGDVVNQGLNAMVYNFGDNKNTFELYHYFGDPAMKIWTSNPNNNLITATHNNSIDCTNLTLSIYNSTPFATATLLSNNSLIGLTTLDANGNGIIEHSHPGSGNVELTISKHNFKPYISTLTQTCDSHPPSLVYVNSSNFTASSALLNAHITSENGATITESGFVCSTSAAPSIGGQGVIQFQSNPVATNGSLQLTAEGLQRNTSYFVRAYATNSIGTSYSEENTFETLCESEIEIILGSNSINFGNTFLNTTKTINLEIANLCSNSTLIINKIVSSSNDITSSISSTNIEPNDTSILSISFNPQSVKYYNEIISILTNGADTVINVYGNGIAPPQLNTDPESVAIQINAGYSKTDTLTISNTGEGELKFNILNYGIPPVIDPQDEVSFPYLDLAKGEPDPREVANTDYSTGGPDNFGYKWIDSDDAYGPVFKWTDISSTGTMVTGLQDDISLGPFPISFDFPFYEDSYNEFYISSNGFITFGNTSYDIVNQTIPTSSPPNNFIAWCWDDLNPGDDLNPKGTINYQDNGDEMVIQFTNYEEYDDLGTITAQIILNKTGSIKIQYLNTANNFNTAESTIGIENSSGSDGLQVAFNSNYIHDSLAIFISAVPSWLDISPVSGTLSKGESKDILLNFNTYKINCGTFASALCISSNSQNNPELNIDIDLLVADEPKVFIFETSVEFEPTNISEIATDTLLIYNSGNCDNLVINTELSNLDFSVDKKRLEIPPSSFDTLFIHFSPTSIGLISGLLTLNSNDTSTPAKTIELSGIGQGFFVVTSHDTISEQINAGDSVTVSLTVKNSGTEDFTYTIVNDIVRENHNIQETESSSSDQFIIPNDYSLPKGMPTQKYNDELPVFSDQETNLLNDMSLGMLDSSIIYFENFESGSSGWTHQSTYTDNIDLWALSQTRFSSGTNSWNVAQHDGVGSDVLISPLIDISKLEDSFLSFKHWYNFDDCGNSTSEPDGGIVEISTDGNNWTQIFPVNGYPYKMDISCNNPLALYKAYSHNGGDGNDFLTAYFDLTPYVGNTIQIRFHAGWDCGNCQASEGWYIDDVSIYSSPLKPWLSYNPKTGTIPVGDSAIIAVKLNAKDLYKDNYEALINIKDIDHGNNSVFIPIYLTVDGEPQLTLSNTTIDFGKVIINKSSTKKIGLFNTGTADLLISDIMVNNPHFSNSESSYNINPGDSAELSLKFSPDTLKKYSSELIITDNTIKTPTKLALSGRGNEYTDSLALVALYNSTRGDKWINNENWLTEPLSTWHGVTLLNDSVTEINLNNNNLEGFLPEKIGDLLALEILILSNNKGITGVIPTTIEKLTKLSYCFLQNNTLRGKLSSSMADIVKKGETATPAELIESMKNTLENNSNNNEASEDFNENYHLKIENNKFTFCDILNSGVSESDVSNFTYAPQDTSFTLAYINQTITALDCQSPSNTFSWFKDGTLLPYTTRTIDYQGSGSYFYTVRNPNLPMLTLYSDTILYEIPIQSIQNNLLVGNTTLGNGESDCYNAYDTITVGGDENKVEFESGSSATLIAGVSIKFKPGFHALEGSFMSAYITTTASFCDQLSESMVAAEPIAIKSMEDLIVPSEEEENTTQASLLVYPNPNKGQFTIQLDNMESQVQIIIFNAVGTAVQQQITNDKFINVDLSNVKRGIYFVRAINNKEQFTQKLIIE